MSAEVDLLKKLVDNDQVVAAVELPTSRNGKTLVVDDIEDVLAHFDDDTDYANFVVRVKRSNKSLPKNSLPTESSDQLSSNDSLDSLLNETFELNEQLSAAHVDPNAPSASAPAAPEGDYDGDFLLSNAKLLEDHGDTALARNIYNALVRKGQLIPQGLFGVARTYEKDGNTEKAIRFYQEAIAYSSEYPFYQAMAALQIRIGEDGEASKTLLHALGIANLSTDQNFELHKSIGNCFTRLNDYPKAEHHYKKAYEFNPDSDLLQVNVGSLALQKGDHDSALTHFQKALELNKNNDRAISGLGMVYMAKGQTQKAHDCFATSLKINVNNLGSLYNLVKCAYELKKFNDAESILKSYVETKNVNTNVRFSYAGILFHRENFTQALNEVKKILESNPDHAGAKELLARIQAKV